MESQPETSPLPPDGQPVNSKKWFKKTGWIIVLLVLFFPAGLFLMWKYTNWPKGLKWLISAICTLFLLISLIPSQTAKNQTQQALTGNNTATATPLPTQIATPSPKPPTISGLNITRDAVITGFQRIDPSINFQPSTTVNGIDRYMATIGQSGIELYGKADNLVEVASTALFDNNASNHAGNVAALVYIIGAANIVDEASKSWVTSTLEEISTAWQNGQTSVKKSTVINSKKFDMTALKSDALDTISLTIYSSQNSTPPTDTKTGPYDPLHDPNAFPGLTKLKLNASLVSNAQGMVFTNNDTKDWQNCAVTINPEDGASNWYEYDFGNIAAHQAYNLIPWEKLTREDSTTFDHSTMTAKTIELYCEFDAKTIGLADFPGK